MDALLLRFDAPLMSFGSTAVDEINPTDRFPGRGMLTGLLGNALGWDHRDIDKLSALQERLRIACRWDAEPELLIDYHTVDLGQAHLVDTGWTTRGRREDRGGGEARKGTHIRFRHYWANGVCTVAVTLTGGGEPTLADLEVALHTPARPLFLGRKTCLPAVPLLLGRRQGESLRALLASEPLADVGPRPTPSKLPARWPAEEGGGSSVLYLADRRDWRANVPRGYHDYVEGVLELSP